VSNDFEVGREHDQSETDRPDPEEPSTWQPADARSDAEVDASDWTDQHSAVADLFPEEDGPAGIEDSLASRDG